MFAFQIIENIGMTIGLMPVTGITLPFLSYGGSSIMTSMIAVGLALNVYMRRKRSSFSQ
jgi:rod shape determining protein RodA